MKDYVDKFRKKIAQIDADSKGVRIINAGVMNHGKSSLLNSLLNMEEFKAEDVRTTMINSEANWFDDVYLVDTPGLNAEKADDKEAYIAYARANMIVFCHTIKVGELRKTEMDAINAIKSLFENEVTFWEHFCLVFTFLDADTPQNASIIMNKSLADIEKYCGSKNFPTFLVSNSRYKKGRTENKTPLIELSGIPKFRDFLKSKCEKWRGENNRFRSVRITKEKENLLKELELEKGMVKSKIRVKKENIKQKQQDMYTELKDLFSEREYNEQTIGNMYSVRNSLVEEYNELVERHNREYF